MHLKPILVYEIVVCKMSSLDTILQHSSQQMKLAFEEASKKYKTPDDIAQHREEIVMQFLKEYFPPTYKFGKGEIVDSNGNRSGQIDVVICNPYHPFTIAESGMGLFFAEGIACTIEVKSDLSDKGELERGLRQISNVKRLQRKPMQGDMMLGTKYDQDRLKQIPAILFGYRAPSLGTLKTNILDVYEKLDVPVEEQVDAIVVLNNGIIYNIKDSRDKLVITVKGQRILGLTGIIEGDRTLMAFLLYLSYVIPKEIRMAPIIQLYIGALDKRARNVKVV